MHVSGERKFFLIHKIFKNIFKISKLIDHDDEKIFLYNIKLDLFNFLFLDTIDRYCLS